MNQRYLSTTQAAKVLGVSVATVKRWADDKILLADLTPGGHRKILRSELDRLIHSKRLPSVSLPEAEQALEDIAKDFQSAVLQDSARRTRQLLRQAYDQGESIADIADVMISPTMREVGHQWEQGSLDVYEEHRATQLCLQGLHELRGRLDGEVRADCPLAIGGCPEGDHYRLATLLAEMVLLQQDWRTLHLGANTPTASFRQAIDKHRPVLLWLSVNYVSNTERFLSEYADLYGFCKERDVRVIVGGNALGDALPRKMAYSSFGHGLGHLETYAESLHPRSSKRRRGVKAPTTDA